MSLFIVLTPEEAALERAADALLRAQPPDPERPAYTERQFAQRGRCLVSVEHLVQTVAAPPQPFREELRFLASVSRLDPDSRRYMRLWTDGWSQQEIAAALNVSQQYVSQRLHHALRLCYDVAPLSFRRFSHHTIYHPPEKRRRSRIMARRCARCGEEFPLGLGHGRYCSSLCREPALREGRKKQK
jgi:hypothetical protein